MIYKHLGAGLFVPQEWEPEGAKDPCPYIYDVQQDKYPPPSTNIGDYRGLGFNKFFGEKLYKKCGVKVAFPVEKEAVYVIVRESGNERVVDKGTLTEAELANLGINK